MLESFKPLLDISSLQNRSPFKALIGEDQDRHVPWKGKRGRTKTGIRINNKLIGEENWDHKKSAYK